MAIRVKANPPTIILELPMDKGEAPAGAKACVVPVVPYKTEASIT